jgi:hypothetical protein
MNADVSDRPRPVVWAGPGRWRQALVSGFSLLGVATVLALVWRFSGVPGPPVYPWGLELTFNAAGNLASWAYSGQGWSRPEPEITWTEGARADLLLAVDKTDRDRELVADVFPFAWPPAFRQRVTVLVNDVAVGEAEVTGRTGLTVVVPRAVIARHRLMTVTFLLPDARSPLSLGPSPDGRNLGLAFYSLAVR